ncbi:MAG: ABC transporter permease [Lachnospiraceae bacterium]|nr:ABC transporter permease [Lachnospiraceae bacterium]
MSISDLFKMGLRNLSRRKARTALTVLGVVIGTISIVVMVSIGIGVNRSFDKQFMENGEMTIIKIQSEGDMYDEEGNWTGSKTQILNDALIEQLKTLDHVKVVSPVIETEARLYSGNYSTYIQLKAVGVDAFREFGFPDLTYGSYPTEKNPATIVLAANSLSNFYYYSPNGNYKTKTVDPSNTVVTLKFDSWKYKRNERKKEYELKIKDYCQMAETDNYEYGYACYMTIDYFKEIYAKYANTLTIEDRKKALASLDTYNYINVNVDNIKNVTKVQEAIKEMGFSTFSEMQYLEPLKETSNMLQLVLGAIGAVAMLVSAINIANTMVMSIYERTREIGIMKVLGCKVGDIKRLFLFESAMIGLYGGIIGVILSYIASHFINKYGGTLFAALMSGSGVYNIEDASFSVIPIWLPFMAAGFGILVGVLAGYFPARRATRISAIEAMKNDA